MINTFNLVPFMCVLALLTLLLGGVEVLTVASGKTHSGGMRIGLKSNTIKNLTLPKKNPARAAGFSVIDN
jgi:hypothetical protein